MDDYVGRDHTGCRVIGGGQGGKERTVTRARIPAAGDRRYLVVQLAQGLTDCFDDYHVVAVNETGESDPGRAR